MFRSLLNKVPDYPCDTLAIQELMAPSLLSHHLGPLQSKTTTVQQIDATYIGYVQAEPKNWTAYIIMYLLKLE